MARRRFDDEKSIEGEKKVGVVKIIRRWHSESNGSLHSLPSLFGRWVLNNLECVLTD